MACNSGVEGTGGVSPLPPPRETWEVDLPKEITQKTGNAKIYMRRLRTHNSENVLNWRAMGESSMAARFPDLIPRYLTQCLMVSRFWGSGASDLWIQTDTCAYTHTLPTHQ